jgi:alanine dehydrogenase
MSKTLFLNEAEVTQLLTMPDAIRSVEDAFRDLGQGSATNRPRQRVRAPNGVMHVMLAGLPTRGYLGLKYYSGFRPKTRFWFHLIDANNGDLVCVMQADRLGQQRTGASSGVATKYLAREDAARVGIIGTGWQAVSQLEAVCAVRKISHIRCYSRDAAHRNRFAGEMSRQLKIEVRDVDTAQSAVREADIVITATSAREPVLLGEWLAPGTHVNAVGSNRADARELDDSAVSRAAFICVDSREQSQIESGDLIVPCERKSLSWEHVKELGEVVSGKLTGRKNRDDITLFKSNGIALEDVAVGAWVYERARAQGVGHEVEL